MSTDDPNNFAVERLMRHNGIRSARLRSIPAALTSQHFQRLSPTTYDLKRKSLDLLINTKILLFLAFLALFRLTVLIRRRPNNVFDVIDNYAMLDIVVTVLAILFVIFNQNLHSSLRNTIHKSAGIFLLYYLICVFSSFWSPLPEYSLFRSIQVLSQLLVIFILLYECNSFGLAEVFLLRTVVVIIAIDMIGTLFRSHFNFSFVALHTNSYSNSAAMLCCYCLSEYFTAEENRKSMLKKYGITSFIVTLIGTSAASNIALVVGLFFANFFSKHTKQRFLFILLTVIFIVVGFASHTVLQFGVHQFLLAGKDPDRVRTLTGRTQMWEYYFDRAQEKPVMGHGFAIATHIGGHYATTTHNFLLSVFLDLGVLGMLMVLWVMSRMISEMRQTSQHGAIGRTGLIGVFITAFIACQSAPFVAVVWSAPSAVFALFLAFHTYYGTQEPVALHHALNPIARRSQATLRNRMQRKPHEFKRNRYLQYRRWPSR